MNLQVKINILLPVWLLIWFTSVLIFSDLSFGKAEPIKVRVMYLNTVVSGKGEKHCQLRLLLPQGLVERGTDAQTCEILFVGAVLILERTIIFDRWLGLHDRNYNKVTGVILENSVFKDIIFILFSILMPILFKRKLNTKAKQIALVFFSLQIFWLIHYWTLLLT